MFNRHATVLPQYSSRSADVTPLRAGLVLLAKVMLGAGYGALIVLLPQTMVFFLALPIVAMLLLTLWMLPDRGVFPLGAIERTFSIYLVLMILWPVYIAFDVPGLPWITPTRLVLFALIFLFVYSVSTSAALRHQLLTIAKSSKSIWICFLIFEVVQVITIPLSRSPATSLNGMLNNQVYLVGMLFIGCLVFTKPGWATWTIGALVATAVIASLIGFVELRLGYPPWANHIPSFMRVDEKTMSTVLGTQARFSDGLYRVRGPFTISLLLAEFLALMIPFVLHWMVTGRSLRLRLLMIAAWPIIIYAIIVSQSRLGLVGAFFGHLAYLLIWGIRRWRQNSSSIVGPAVVLGFPALAAVVVVLILSSGTLTNRVLGGAAASASDNARAIQREMAVPRILANPIGYGVNRGGTTLGYTNPGGYLTIDNHYITTVLEIGIVGFFAFYLMFLIGGWNGVMLFFSTKDRETELEGPLAVTMGMFVVFKSVLSQNDNHPLVFLLLGMILALQARERRLLTAPEAAPASPPGQGIYLPQPAGAVPA